MISTLLDIGNTATRIARCENGVMTAVKRIPTSKLTADCLPPDLPAAAACVVPAAAKRLEGRGVFFLTALNCRIPIDFSQVEAHAVGADRVANLAALAEYYPLPAICVDCGTAITLEVLDADRVCTGGAILPGRLLQRKVLFQGTAQLPDLTPGKTLLREPGPDTATNIDFGVDMGLVGAIRALVAAAQARFRGRATVVIAGGDAPFFAAEFPEFTPAPEDFTLQGVRLGAGWR